MEVFSTITSPVFSELVIVLTSRDVDYLHWGGLFRTLRAMNEDRPFKLVFFLEGLHFSLGEARRKLARALDSMITKGLFDFLDSSPTIRSTQSPQGEWDMSFPNLD